MSRNLLPTITPFHPAPTRGGSAPSLAPRTRPSERSSSRHPSAQESHGQPSWEELLGRR